MLQPVSFLNTFHIQLIAAVCTLGDIDGTTLVQRTAGFFSLLRRMLHSIREAREFAISLLAAVNLILQATVRAARYLHFETMLATQLSTLDFGRAPSLSIGLEVALRFLWRRRRRR